MTTSKSIAPVLRNVFQIIYAGDDQCDGKLRYGDKIRLEAEAGNKKVNIKVNTVIFAKFGSIANEKFQV